MDVAVSGVKAGKECDALGRFFRERGTKPLWIEIKTAMNDTCLELLIRV